MHVPFLGIEHIVNLSFSRADGRTLDRLATTVLCDRLQFVLVRSVPIGSPSVQEDNLLCFLEISTDFRLAGPLCREIQSW